MEASPSRCVSCFLFFSSIPVFPFATDSFVLVASRLERASCDLPVANNAIHDGARTLVIANPSSRFSRWYARWLVGKESHAYEQDIFLGARTSNLCSFGRTVAPGLARSNAPIYEPFNRRLSRSVRKYGKTSESFSRYSWITNVTTSRSATDMAQFSSDSEAIRHIPDREPALLSMLQVDYFTSIIVIENSSRRQSRVFHNHHEFCGDTSLLNRRDLIGIIVRFTLRKKETK